MILNLLAIVCASIIWVKFLPILYYIKATRAILDGSNKHKRLKPLDCESCLSFWGSLGYILATAPELWPLAFIVYVFTALLTKLI